VPASILVHDGLEDRGAEVAGDSWTGTRRSQVTPGRGREGRRQLLGGHEEVAGGSTGASLTRYAVACAMRPASVRIPAEYAPMMNQEPLLRGRRSEDGGAAPATRSSRYSVLIQRVVVGSMGGGCDAGRGRVGRKISGAGSVYGQLSVGWPVNGVNLGFSLLTLHTVQIASKADPTDG
jgi:hypothetical protein